MVDHAAGRRTCSLRLEVGSVGDGQTQETSVTAAWVSRRQEVLRGLCSPAASGVTCVLEAKGHKGIGDALHVRRVETVAVAARELLCALAREGD